MNQRLKSNLPYLFIGLFVFVYIVLRAIYIPPYFDEITTFFTYVQTGAFQPYYSFLDANNHVLNSFLERLSYLVFGHGIFALRLPNVLSFILYAIYTWKLARFFKSKWIGISFYITMLGSLYLLSFFSLARGYGLSMAFLSASVYYLISFSERQKNATLVAGLLFSVFALWANLSLMLAVLLIGGLFIWIVLKKFYATWANKEFITTLLICVFIYAIPVFFAVKYSFELKEAGALYHGSYKGFVDAILLHIPAEFAGTFNTGIIIFFTLQIIYLSAIIFSFKKQFQNRSVYVQALFTGTIAGTVLLHLLLKVNYPTERAAIHFFVLFIIAFFFALDAAGKKIFRYLSPIPAAVFIMQLISTFNLQYAMCWKTETVPFSFYQKLEDWKKEHSVLPTVSAHGLMGEVIHFYDFLNGGNLNNTQRKDFPGKSADFLITNYWNRYDKIEGYDTLEHHPETNVTLWQRSKPMKWEKILTGDANEINPKAEYINLYTAQADSFINKPFCFDAELRLQSPDFPMQAWLICSVSDSAGQNLSYNEIYLQRIKQDYKETQIIERRQYIENIPATAKSISFYIWNLKKQKINISDVKIELMRSAD